MDEGDHKGLGWTMPILCRRAAKSGGMSSGSCCWEMEEASARRAGVSTLAMGSIWLRDSSDCLLTVFFGVECLRLL